jgi:alkyl hydroperoxide reductase subunit AhpC
MGLHIGDEAPNFTADTTRGKIDFHQWIGDGWAVLFSHPKDFTPICTTELGYMAGLESDFAKRNCKIIGLSCDSVEDHLAWSKDIEKAQGHPVDYPIIDGSDLSVAKAYDMIHPNASGSAKSRTPVDNQTIRSVFIIGPDKKVKAMLTYPMSSGRNFDEVLRLLDSIQLTAKYQVSTPVNWRPGEDVVIPAAMTDEAARQKYPDGVREVTPYLRYVRQPKG